jgi:transcriptional regulator with XRE-family HTH domain
MPTCGMHMGQKIKKARKAAGYSQLAAAPLLGCDNSHLSKIENGHDKPSLELLTRMSEVFQTPLRDLVPADYEYGHVELITDSDEIAWLRHFRSLPADQRRALLAALTGKNP